MEQTKEKTEEKQQWRVAWIIWGAMAAAIVIYGVIGHMLAAAGTLGGFDDADIPLPLIRNILLAVALLQLAALPFIRGRMLAGTRVPGAGTMYAGAGARYIIVVIVSAALSEAVAIYGLVLLLLGDSFTTLYFFLGLSVLAMLYSRPKRAEISAPSLGNVRQMPGGKEAGRS